MAMAAEELPDDIDALKAIVLALAEKTTLLEDQAARNVCLAAERIKASDIRAEEAEARIKAADERIATLTAIVKMLERSRYGRRSEATSNVPSCSRRSRAASARRLPIWKLWSPIVRSARRARAKDLCCCPRMIVREVKIAQRVCGVGLLFRRA